MQCQCSAKQSLVHWQGAHIDKGCSECLAQKSGHHHLVHWCKMKRAKQNSAVHYIILQYIKETLFSRGCSTNTSGLPSFIDFTLPFPPNLHSTFTPKLYGLGTWNFYRIFTSRCVSLVTCHVSHVTCHMSHVMFFSEVELVVGGTVFNGANPV